MSDEIRVYEMNDCDWMAAASPESATEVYRRDFGGDEFEDGEPRPLTDREMDGLMFHEDNGEKRTFRAQLANMVVEGRPFPQFFASTEF